MLRFDDICDASITANAHGIDVDGSTEVDFDSPAPPRAFRWLRFGSLVLRVNFAAANLPF